MHVGKWFHHLFNPHCPDCLAEQTCESCEILKDELKLERAQNAKLLQVIIDFNKPKEVIVQKEEIELRPMNNRLSWNARRQLLEQEDAAAAKLIQDKKNELKTTEQLEKELLGKENASQVS